MTPPEPDTPPDTGLPLVVGGFGFAAAALVAMWLIGRRRAAN
jgi:hypothetical protein